VNNNQTDVQNRTLLCSFLTSYGRYRTLYFRALSGGFSGPPTLCRGYMWNKIISELFQPSSSSLWNNFHFCAWKLAWNYFKIISEYYCSSWIFSNMFNVAEVILKWFQNSSGGWNNFISVLRAVTCEIKRWNKFDIISVFDLHRRWLHVK